MIVEAMIDLFITLLTSIMNSVNIIGIPLNGIQVLSTICAYGSYVVGADLLLTFAGCVAMWMILKLQLGLLLFIWRLLPFT